MTHKPLLAGRRAKALFGDLSEVAARTVDALGAALLAQFEGNEQATISALAAALKDGMTLQRTLTLLESGQVEQAEKLILAKEKERKR